jgi:hypothetical protein
MKNTFVLFVCAALTLVGSGVLFGCHQKGDQAAQKQAHKNEAKLHDLATLHDLAAKYGAIQDWEKPLDNKTNVFTIDVQDALLNTPAPLEFTGALFDIRREGGHIVAHFLALASFPLSLNLACTEDQHRILTDREATYAIIAEIQNVTKLEGLNVNGLNIEKGVVEHPTFDVNWETDTYCATGKCLDVRKLDE